MKTTRKKRRTGLVRMMREAKEMWDVKVRPSMNENAVAADVSLHAWLMFL
jgi:hypothetical protein